MTSDHQNINPEPMDQAEFHLLFMRNQRRIFGHILALLPHMADAEEVFQQTCVIILGKAAQFSPGTEFVRWACQIAQYEAYNYRRRLQAERLHFDDALLERIASRRLEEGDLLESELDALHRCVEKLPPSDRQLIREQYRRKITAKALAAELGKPANTVYKAIQRIRRGLRVCVEKALSRQSHEQPVAPAEEDPS